MDSSFERRAPLVSSFERRASCGVGWGRGGSPAGTTWAWSLRQPLLLTPGSESDRGMGGGGVLSNQGLGSGCGQDRASN